jgi:hypothetical protein
MRKAMVKKLASIALASVFALGCLSGCGTGKSETTGTESTGANTVTEAPAATTGAEASDNAAATDSTTAADTETASKGGTILYLSSVSSGPEYDGVTAYAEKVCDELGYKFKVVYGDSFNDPAANLNALKNGMTSDVVGIILNQDGGVKNIMDEYPDLYVVGAGSDMASVYGDGGASADCAKNSKFLGTMANGHVDGSITGKLYADMCIEKGFKKVATVIFPPYAFPNLAAADASFRQEIATYNESAAEDQKIEIVKDAKVLEFAPLDEAWFLDEGNGDLDAIVAMMDGIDFVYPTLKSAMANGNCSADTKLITGGFSTDASLTADVGETGVISAICITPMENIAWSIAMLDNAISGTMYSDYTASERIDSMDYVIDSKEDMDNVLAKSIIGTGNADNAQLSFDDLKTVLTRYNPNATYADLKALFQSDQLLTDALAQ